MEKEIKSKQFDIESGSLQSMKEERKKSSRNTRKASLWPEGSER
jgi:hypothetical protein